MGYTHYFPQSRSFSDEEWTDLIACFEKIVDLCSARGIKLEDLEKNDRLLSFNGSGPHSHEAFVLHKDEISSSHFFCKTARKPYDLAVCMVLIACHNIAPGALTISSDGDWVKNWGVARAYYRALMKENPTCPFEEEQDNGEGDCEGGDCEGGEENRDKKRLREDALDDETRRIPQPTGTKRLKNKE